MNSLAINSDKLYYNLSIVSYYNCSLRWAFSPFVKNMLEISIPHLFIFIFWTGKRKYLRSKWKKFPLFLTPFPDMLNLFLYFTIFTVSNSLHSGDGYFFSSLSERNTEILEDNLDHCESGYFGDDCKKLWFVLIFWKAKEGNLFQRAL